MTNQESIDEFWMETLAMAAQVPLEADALPVKVRAPYRQERVSFQSLGGTRLVANLSRPVETDRAGTRLPGLLTFPGYGGVEFGQTLSECQRGYVMLQVYPRMQGESGPAVDGVSHLLRGIESPESYYYRGVYVDALRALEYLVARPDVDSSRLGVVGTSQGGAIALATAALDERIKAGAAHVPFFCDMRHNPAFEGNAIRLRENLDTFDFFDPANLADRISVPFLVSSGGEDTTSPPETIRAVYDRLQGVKAIFHDPTLPHTSSTAFYHMTWAWLENHL